MLNEQPALTPAPLLYRYERPTLAPGRVKAVRWLGRTDYAYGAVHRIGAGGENVLHAHRYSDGFWIVLTGRARFYTTGDRLLADLGALEGIVVPRNFPYWFEAASAEGLELLQFEASSRPRSSFDSDRIGFARQAADWHDQIDKADAFVHWTQASRD